MTSERPKSPWSKVRQSQLRRSIGNLAADGARVNAAEQVLADAKKLENVSRRELSTWLAGSIGQILAVRGSAISIKFMGGVEMPQVRWVYVPADAYEVRGVGRYVSPVDKSKHVHEIVQLSPPSNQNIDYFVVPIDCLEPVTQRQIDHEPRPN